MQRLTPIEDFYNFSNLFSYNFERSDPKKNKAMNKNYKKPTMLAVKLQHQNIIAASPVNSIKSNTDAGLTYGGASNGDELARVKQGNIWDEEW